MNTRRRFARLVSCTSIPATESGGPLALDLLVDGRQKRRAVQGGPSLRCDTTFEFNVPQVAPSAPTKSKWDVFCALYGSRDGLCECHGTEGDALLYEVIVGSDPLWRQVLASRASHAHCPRDIRLWYPLLKTTYSTATAADIAEIDARHASLVGSATSRRGKQLRLLMRDGEMMQSFASELLGSVGLEFGGPIEIGVAASVVYLVVDVFNGGLLMPPYLAKVALTELLSCVDGAPSSASEQVGSMTLVHALFRVVEPWAQTALLAEWREMLQSIVRSVACTLTDAVRAVANELRTPAVLLTQWEWRVPAISSRQLWIQYPAPFSEALDNAVSSACSTRVVACGWAEEVAFDRLVAVRGGTWFPVRQVDVSRRLAAGQLAMIAAAPNYSGPKTPPLFDITSGDSSPSRSTCLVDDLVQLSVEYCSAHPTASSIGVNGTTAKERVASALTTPSRPDSGFSVGTEDVDWTSPNVKSTMKKKKARRGEEQHWSAPLRAAMGRGDDIVAANVSVEPQQVPFNDKGWAHYYPVDPGETRLLPDFVCSGICVKTATQTPTISRKALPQFATRVLAQRSASEHEVIVWLRDERCAVRLCFMMNLQAVLRILYDSNQTKCDNKVFFGQTQRGGAGPEPIDVACYEQDLQPKDTYGLLEMEKSEEGSSRQPSAEPCSDGNALIPLPDRHTFTFDAFVCCSDAQVDQLLRTALICNAGGVGLARFLLQLSKDEQEAHRMRMAERSYECDDQTVGCETDVDERALFSSAQIANLSHVTLVVEVSPLEPTTGAVGVAGQSEMSLADRTRLMHELAKKGMRCVSMSAAIATELKQCNDNMHVPMPLGGIYPRMLGGPIRKRDVQDTIPLAKPKETLFLSRMPMNRHYLFNFVKSDAEAALARSLTPAPVIAEQQRYNNGERCVSVPLRVVDGAALDTHSSVIALPPIAQPRQQGRSLAPARDEGLQAPSSSLAQSPPVKGFTPFAVSPPLPQQLGGIEDTVYAALFARSRSISPNSKRAVNASNCLGSIVAHAAASRKPATKRLAKLERTGSNGRGTEEGLDPIGAVQLQLSSYVHAAKAVSEGRGDVARRPLDLR